MIVQKGTDEWKAHKRILFQVDGRESFIVVPKVSAKGNPWAWRTEFFGAFDTVDTALLEKGWHLAYHRVSNMYGCPTSIEYMRAFQEDVTDAYGLNPKAVLFGFSRGGLYAVNYAAAYPDKVCALYLDAPVLDILSWPGGKGKGTGSTDCWADCLKIYGLTESTAVHFKQNPMDRAEKLAKDGIPIIAVVGLADRCVPYTENMLPFKERYQMAGGDVRIIGKPGCDHHPHSLEDPTEVVGFIQNAFESPLVSSPLEAQEWTNFWWESAPDRQKRRVLLIGDSITNGYRHTVNKALQGEFYASVWATSKALDHPDFFSEMEYMWSQNNYSYELVHFNNGLHGWHLSNDEYERLYELVVRHICIQHPSTTLTLALSTPVCLPDAGAQPDPDRNEVVKQRNRIVLKIAGKYKLAVDDLYSAMWGKNEYRKNDGYHFNEAGMIYQGSVAADFIRSRLA